MDRSLRLVAVPLAASGLVTVLRLTGELARWSPAALAWPGLARTLLALAAQLVFWVGFTVVLPTGTKQPVPFQPEIGDAPRQISEKVVAALGSSS